ncbi:MAG: hypothetical protein GX889_12005 [Clostridiales bacterium]|nr:hypothetical protein [Clostridiales bacterium]
MKNLMNRIKYVMQGEDGASNLEIVVWFSVVLMIATALFFFKDAIVRFTQKTGNKVNALNLE